MKKWRPRKIASLIVGVIFAFLLAGGAQGVEGETDNCYVPPPYSYDGPIDPVSLTHWKIVGEKMNDPITGVLGLKDPASDSHAMVVLCSGARLPYDILGYLIFKDGKVTHYWLDMELFKESNGLIIYYRTNNEIFEPGIYKKVQDVFFEVTGVQLPELSNL